MWSKFESVVVFYRLFVQLLPLTPWLISLVVFFLEKNDEIKEIKISHYSDRFVNVKLTVNSLTQSISLHKFVLYLCSFLTKKERRSKSRIGERDSARFSNAKLSLSFNTMLYLVPLALYIYILLLSLWLIRCLKLFIYFGSDLLRLSAFVCTYRFECCLIVCIWDKYNWCFTLWCFRFFRSFYFLFLAFLVALFIYFHIKFDTVLMQNVICHIIPRSLLLAFFRLFEKRHVNRLK